MSLSPRDMIVRLQLNGILRGVFLFFDMDDEFRAATDIGSKELYEVRTRKVLLYSNAIASASNVLYVAFTNDVKKLDIGGILVTIYRIVTDEKFIRQVMNEFINSEVSKVYEDKLREVNIKYDELIEELGYEH